MLTSGALVRADVTGSILGVVHDRSQAVVAGARIVATNVRSEEHTSELQSRLHLVYRLLLEKKNRDTPANTLGMVTIPTRIASMTPIVITTMPRQRNPLTTINVTMSDIKSKHVYITVNSKTT